MNNDNADDNRQQLENIEILDKKIYEESNKPSLSIRCGTEEFRSVVKDSLEKIEINVNNNQTEVNLLKKSLIDSTNIINELKEQVDQLQKQNNQLQEQNKEILLILRSMGAKNIDNNDNKKIVRKTCKFCSGKFDPTVSTLCPKNIYHPGDDKYVYYVRLWTCCKRGKDEKGCTQGFHEE
eukprot:TRINITY_DN244_c2_g1_i6.p1 TRINITY_DN244_c2_g1~~TRINITY_DN244_c2_g1_i6.p1  ORF type:complete len:191 (-),score=46.22 TRINITY_DN244_c2_g1_i6:241-780(-)